MLEFAQWREAPIFSQRTLALQALRAPQLAVERTGRLRELASSLLILLRGTEPPLQFEEVAYFRDRIEPRFPRAAFVVAVAIQALLIAYPPPIWNTHPSNVISVPVQQELTWFGPAEDLPLLLPEAPKPTPAPTPEVRNATPKTPPEPGSDAFHPRQTILSEPLHPTHPRQTLIEPDAPREPPKILPALPNIVQLASSQPARPKLQLTSEDLSVLRPKTASPPTVSAVAAPQISNSESTAGAINISPSSRELQKPLLPVNPMSAPHAATQQGEPNPAVPDVAGNVGEDQTLIALSATPAPVAPPPVIPAGNLSARVSISPEGPHPGTPGSTAGNSTAGPASGGGGRGLEGVSITGGQAANPSPVSGLGIGQASRAAGSALPSRLAPRLRIAPEGSTSAPSGDPGSAAAAKLGMSPERILGSKRVYTLHVNMPNLTSASGSWILNFAELNEEDISGYRKPETQQVLAGPVPLRKVDPKYPPELRASHVDGEVVLYAIIRKDGSVDSIQLVHSVDALLDQNAMEALALWKFEPAEKNGQPIDLEAVVRIPFRSRLPAF